MNANRNGNQPKEKNAFIFFPLLIPISNKKIAKNPLNKSFVNGLIPSACFVSAMNPMSKLPKINKTLPLVNEWRNTLRLLNESLPSLLNFEIKIKPIMIAGDSIKAIIATM